MGSRSRKAPTTTSIPEEERAPSVPTEVPERWSAARKAELVLRLLRGETLDSVSRDSQVPAHEIDG